MTTINFPSSPTLNTTYTYNGRTWKYNGTGWILFTSDLPIANSTTGGLISASSWATFNAKQPALVSGTNIKTINGLSVLGSGNFNTALEKTLTYPGVIKTSTGAARWWLPAFTHISKVSANLSSAPEGADIIIVLKKNDSSIYTLVVPAGSTAATADVNLTAEPGEYITADITQVGFPVPGSALVVSLLYTRS